MNKPIPAQSMNRIVIRLDDDLYFDFMQRAQRNRRSMSAEGAVILEAALAAEKTASEPTA